MPFGIGIYNVKSEVNIGTLWRSAYNLGASFIFSTGRRYKKQSSDTVNAIEQIPYYSYDSIDQFLQNRPIRYELVAIELDENSHSLINFVHPKNAIYLLGAEDHGISKTILAKCQHIVQIPSKHCLNVATAGSIVLYDRLVKEHHRKVSYSTK